MEELAAIRSKCEMTLFSTKASHARLICTSCIYVALSTLSRFRRSERRCPRAASFAATARVIEATIFVAESTIGVDSLPSEGRRNQAAVA
jgi:hypothetical protein